MPALSGVGRKCFLTEVKNDRKTIQLKYYRQNGDPFRSIPASAFCPDGSIKMDTQDKEKLGRGKYGVRTTTSSGSTFPLPRSIKWFGSLYFAKIFRVEPGAVMNFCAFLHARRG